MVVGAAALLAMTSPAASASTTETPVLGEARTTDTPVLEVPPPTGPFQVGAHTLHLRDDSRADPWVPEERRELMVTLRYPALLPVGHPQPYVTPGESAVLVDVLGLGDAPDDLLNTTRTHARTDAPMLSHPGGRPLVVLSPGFSLPRATLTALAEDLASRGYVVAAVDHTYEAHAISFPDGRIAECLACERPLSGPAVAAGRAADVSFVIDELLSDDSAWGGARVIDGDRIAMAGHSMGGAAALTTMLHDVRVDAGINMDGTFQPELTSAMDRPFVMLGASVHGQPGEDETWNATWEQLTGWKRWLSVDGTSHSSFTDLGFLAEQLGVDLPGQHLSGRRVVEITRDYVAAVFDLHLRDRRQPWLDGPSRRYPEVRFQP